jgi:hypothetical protein
MAHKSVEPAIFYFGTPVVLVTSLNEDGSRIDPVKWRPLIMSFCQFFALGGDMLQHSRLGDPGVGLSAVFRYLKRENRWCRGLRVVGDA